MSYYRSWSHTVYDCRYHLVWITKYRRKRITKDIQIVLTNILYEICEELYVKIIRIGMEEDHVHMYVSIPLMTWHIPDVIQKMKWKSSKILWEEFASHLKKYYWKDWLWVRAVWYFICTVWEVNDTLIKNYIEEQWKNPPKVEKSPGL
jgi:putative transposase